MVRSNNMIPYGHFHKKWQLRIKTWFNQPMKKIHRRRLRASKFQRNTPKPIYALRPMVNCPSIRYNRKIRAGRGFTLKELKNAGLNAKYARTIGIAVDSRRRNRCVESLQRNVHRLKQYKDKLIVYPVQERQAVRLNDGKDLNRVVEGRAKVKVRQISEDEKKFEAFVSLRKARCDGKYAGVRLKRKAPKSEGL